jgi:amino acid adenylation domain-containing protein
MGDAAIKKPYPLSPMQAGMLFQNLYDSEMGVDVEQLLCTFKDVEIPALEYAWLQVWQTNEILRSSFDWSGDEEPTQRTHGQDMALPWQYLDWRGMSGDPHSELKKFLYQDRLQSFNLNQPPLMRFTLIQYRDGNFWLVWTYHHILLDGRSLPVVIRQMAEALQAYEQGKKAVLIPPRPYRDYITWLGEQDWSSAKEYWKEQLRGAPNPVPFWGSRPQLPLPDDEPSYGLLEEYLSPELAGALKYTAEKHSLTLNTLLQGAWAILLNRYSGESDIVFGAIRTGRHSALNGQGTSDMIGLLINTLPVRIQVDPESPVLKVLNDLRAWALRLRDSYAEHIPLSEIQKLGGLQPGNRLFESILGFDALDFGEMLRSQHVSLQKWDFELLEHVGYPLVVMMYGGERIKITLEYDRQLLGHESAGQILGHLFTLLEGIAGDITAPVCRLPLLTDKERQQILVEWTNTAVQHPADKCFHELFEAQVLCTPDKLAAAFEDGERLTYSELNRRANQLAHYLRSLGVGPEKLVGVCLERSLDTLVSLLAIFKSGGAYIPLDPALPSSRLEFMIDNSQALVVLTNSRHAGQVSASQSRIVRLDSDAQEISRQPVTDLVNQSAPKNLAYVIYTSGSTGVPKGAMVEQQGMVNHLYAKIYALDLIESDCIAETAPQSFDISIWQFLSALLVGGTTYIFSEETTHDPARLLDGVEKESVSILEVVPSLLRFMLDELDARGASKNKLAALRWLLLTGEALPPHLIREWFAHYSTIPLMNAYGPTECSDDVTHYSIFQSPPTEMTITPIGRAVANMRLYILDKYMQPVPVGIPGELYVGGIGVGRGYFNNPEKTAAIFSADPFVPGPEARFYKTGDLVRWLPDGNIEFLGRIDFQVKIRGFRIELGEIEAALGKHPSVQEAVVMDRADAAGLKHLVAYITTHVDVHDKDLISSLRDYIKTALPDYMVPGAFVLLDRFPLTPNGKIDRKSLPDPDISLREQEIILPRTPLESKLVQIWSDVLGVENISITDNFFDRGGHSLLATRLFVRIRNAFGVDLPLRVLFDSPTVDDLARQIENIIWAAKQTAAKPVGDDHQHEEIVI